MESYITFEAENTSETFCIQHIQTLQVKEENPQILFFVIKCHRKQASPSRDCAPMPIFRRAYCNAWSIRKKTMTFCNILEECWQNNFVFAS